MRRRVISRMYGVVSAGKEARVYWAKSPEGRDLAVKIYLTATAEFRKGIRKYIEGDPRFEHLLARDTKSLMAAWARKEYRNLIRLHRAGVRVPEPVALNKTILVMEFIGREGRRAPLLKEDPPAPDEAPRTLDIILRYISRAYCKARLVHADLSEYNVMIWEREPVLIDVSQAVDISHPLSREFLQRDLRNLLRFFSREVGISVPDIDEAYRVVTSCREEP